MGWWTDTWERELEDMHGAPKRQIIVPVNDINGVDTAPVLDIIKLMKGVFAVHLDYWHELPNSREWRICYGVENIEDLVEGAREYLRKDHSRFYV